MDHVVVNLFHFLSYLELLQKGIFVELECFNFRAKLTLRQILNTTSVTFKTLQPIVPESGPVVSLIMLSKQVDGRNDKKIE